MTIALQNAGKTVLKSARSYLYDTEHKREAMAAVSVIEKYNGRKLSSQLRKVADDYAISVLGSKRYAPWLYVYSLVRGKFHEGWIPDNFFGKLIVPHVNKELVALTHFKSFSNIVLRTSALPDIAYYVDGVFYDRQMSVLDVHQLRELAVQEQGPVFVKQDRSKRGLGVLKLTAQELSEERFRRIGNCVIQSPIKQHEFFDGLITGSVATTRITTVKDQNGTIGLRAAYLRLGRTDTAWVQSKNSVRVAILDLTGELDEFGYTQDWRRWLKHPDSNCLFVNRRIPKFKDAVQLCLELHSKVPHFTILGWDIAVCESQEIAIMEWNADHCSIEFSEATTGPCFLGLNWEKYRSN